MKKNNGIALSIKFLDWFLLVYLVIINFAPNILGQTAYFFQPFMNVYFIIYSIIITLIIILGIVGLVVIYLMTYTSKFDNSKKEPSVPDYTPIWKHFFQMVKNIVIVYFASISGLNYIATITSMIIIYRILYLIIQRDFFAKMTKLKLAYKE